jgi:phenylpyruvate tautomerase PptA (4-oxalocrotonate tautomerase family)
MPVCNIEGPSGLSFKSKGILIQKVLHALLEAYQIPDDRVFITEYEIANSGHSGHSQDGELIVQKEKARPVCIVHAPEGLPVEPRRKLAESLTKYIADAYEINDYRDILLLIQEYPLHVVANNGYLQNENPEFSSPATS